MEYPSDSAKVSMVRKVVLVRAKVKLMRTQILLTPKTLKV